MKKLMNSKNSNKVASAKIALQELNSSASVTSSTTAVADDATKSNPPQATVDKD